MSTTSTPANGLSAKKSVATDQYQAHDHYLVDELLTEEQKLIRDTARKHVSKHLKPIIEEAFEKELFHPEIIPGLAEIGAFGPMVPTVFEYWGITKTDDFGEMVWSLVELGVFGKTERDSKKDFHAVYSFHDAFCAPFLPAKAADRIVKPKTGAQVG